MSLIGKEIVPWLRLVHGAYNSAVLLLFFRQAWLGFTIRRMRKMKAPLPLDAVKRHRKRGPVLTALGVIGFFAGLTVVTLDERNYLEYWHHLFNGLAIVLLLLVTYRLSKRIKGPDSPYRTPHFVIGILILYLYLVEAFLGIGILF